MYGKTFAGLALAVLIGGVILSAVPGAAVPAADWAKMDASTRLEAVNADIENGFYPWSVSTEKNITNLQATVANLTNQLTTLKACSGNNPALEQRISALEQQVAALQTTQSLGIEVEGDVILGGGNQTLPAGSHVGGDYVDGSATAVQAKQGKMTGANIQLVSLNQPNQGGDELLRGTVGVNGPRWEENRGQETPRTFQAQLWYPGWVPVNGRLIPALIESRQGR